MATDFSASSVTRDNIGMGWIGIWASANRSNHRVPYNSGGTVSGPLMSTNETPSCQSQLRSHVRIPNAAIIKLRVPPALLLDSPPAQRKE